MTDGTTRLAQRWLANLVYGDPLPDRDANLRAAYSGALQQTHPDKWAKALNMARDYLGGTGPRHGDMPADLARLAVPVVGVVEGGRDD